MQRNQLTLFLGLLVLVAGGAMVVPQMLADDATPVVRWTEDDELDVESAPAEPVSLGEDGEQRIDRASVEVGEAPGANDERVALVLRGRVVDKYRAPVAGATVWLDFGRGGARGPGARQRRVPDPVSTDRDGRFAFAGQTFRNLRVALQVAHDRHAIGLFDKDLGRVATEVDVGELVLMAGGEVRGRVTDLDGNGIAGATVRLQPENGNALGRINDRERLLPVATTDVNGFYRQPHVAAGEWAASVTAKRHTQGRSDAFVVEEDQVADVEDVRLGPGFEVTGFVRDERGGPIAEATVILRSEGRQRPNGRGGPGGGGPGAFFGGREHRTRTDNQGRFFLEHLPGATMRLDATAAGYLDHQGSGIDPTLGQPIHITMKDGLRIDGVVASGGRPVTKFAVRAIRVRGLPVPGQPPLDVADVFSRMREGTLDAATSQQLRTQAESMRAQFAGEFRGGRGGREGREDARDLGQPEHHPDGTFVASGLQEGVYEVHVHSPEHARHRTAEIEVSTGQPAPRVAVELDAGLFVAGVVLDARGEPVRGARVELRTPSAFEALGRQRGRGRGGERGAGRDNTNLADLTREVARATAGLQLSLETTTDAKGVFRVEHAPAGTWRLHANARGHAGTATEPFELTADRSDFELRMQRLGSIAGTVRGLGAGDADHARVAVMRHVDPAANEGAGLGALFRGGRNGPGLFQNVEVAADGSYRVENLEAGDYVVRSWIGEMQDLMRELQPVLAGGALPADVAVRAGETTSFDPVLVRPQVGTVAGLVHHNGRPASGFRVELVRQEADGAASGNAGGGGRGRGRGGFGGFGRSFQSAVGPSGSFTLAKVPAGSYQLRVQSGRRGGALHEETVQVVADATIERSITIQTGSLTGTITTDDGSDPTAVAGRVSLLADATQIPADRAELRRENTQGEAMARDGKFRFEMVKPGNYLLVFQGFGREPASVPVVIQGDHTVTVAAGPRNAASGEQPRGAGQQRRGAQGGETPRRGQPRGPGARTGR